MKHPSSELIREKADSRFASITGNLRMLRPRATRWPDSLRDLTSYCNCALANSRLPNCRSSASRPPVSSPDFVAVSISVTSKIEVATSALHSKQYFSILPGSSNNSAWRPQAAHCKIDRSPQLSFGPHNIDVSPAARPLRLLVGIAKCGAEPRLFVEDDKQMREEKPRHSEELSI